MSRPEAEVSMMSLEWLTLLSKLPIDPSIFVYYPWLPRLIALAYTIGKKEGKR